MNETHWISIPENIEPIVGSRSQLQDTLRERFARRVEAGELTPAEMQYVTDVDVSVNKRGLQVTDKQLEKLRLACQLFDVDLKSRDITSHRKVIGPIIVGVKKFCFPMLRVFMKDFLHQQRCFNAAVIDVLAELSSKNESEK